MATSATAIAEPFSPTTATVSQPSGIATGGATSSGLTGPTPGISYTAQGGATGTSGGTSTGTITCNPCCSGLVDGFLPAWFGSDGICPGAVDNTKPVTVWATFRLQAKLEGYTLGGFPVYKSLPEYDCVSGKSVQMIADDYYNPNRLRFVDPYYTGFGPSITIPPTGSFLVRSGFIEVGYNFLRPSGTMSKDRIQPVNIVISRCYKTGELNLIGPNASSVNANNYASLKLDSGYSSCSPFSLEFTVNVIYSVPGGEEHYEGVIQKIDGIRGYWGVVFTL